MAAGTAIRQFLAVSPLTAPAFGLVAIPRLQVSTLRLGRALGVLVNLGARVSVALFIVRYRVSVNVKFSSPPV